MDTLHTTILALIQGITEFLPISSSAHLILPAQLLGWPDQGLAFDTSVHLGSLLAVVWYFRKDITHLTIASWQSVQTRKINPDSRFAFNLIIACLPVLPVGYLLRFDIEQNLRSINVVIATTILFAIVLYIADKVGQKDKSDTELNCKQALLIGISQCLALIPGTSRSGVTMSAALLAGFSREAASRISFLISIPTIAGAATLKIADLIESDIEVIWTDLLIGGLVSLVSAYICIKLFLELISKMGFLPFVIYRFILGLILLTLVLF